MQGSIGLLGDAPSGWAPFGIDCINIYIYLKMTKIKARNFFFCKLIDASKGPPRRCNTIGHDDRCGTKRE